MGRWGGWVRAVVVVAVVAGGVRLFVALPERCPEATPTEARDAVTRAAGWLEANQRPNGAWLYRYDRDAGADLGGYNLVRHAGVLVALYQSAGAGIPGTRTTGDRGVDFAQQRLVRHDDWAAFGEDGAVVSAGPSALLVSALVERRSATGDDEHDELLRELGRFLVGQMEPSGAVAAYWDPDARAPIPGEYSIFYTGETAWALARLANVFPDEEWGEAARAVADYLPERDTAEALFPPTSDHWAAYTYAELASTGSAGEAQHDDAERLADVFGVEVRVESQRWAGGWGGFLYGGPASGAGLGTLGEGSAALVRFAGDELPGLDVRVRCVAGILVARQARASDAAVDGAWFTGGVTQMDDQQHAMSALLAAQPSLAAGGATTGGGADPHGLPWLLVAFLVVANAARIPAPRSAGPVFGIAAAVVGATAVAALAMPFLDVLDVSPATARFAAGLVIGVAAVMTLVQPRPTIDGLLLSAILMLAVSAGADDGVWRVGVAAAVAAVVVVALPAAWRRPVVARPIAAVAALVAIDLAVDGVLGI